ncbi:hypothetical protein SprV_0401671500 [Sparganum proliferum]
MWQRLPQFFRPGKTSGYLTSCLALPIDSSRGVNVTLNPQQGNAPLTQIVTRSPVSQENIRSLDDEEEEHEVYNRDFIQDQLDLSDDLSLSFLHDGPALGQVEGNDPGEDSEHLELQTGTHSVQPFGLLAGIEELISAGRAVVFKDNTHSGFKQLQYLSHDKALYVVASGATLLKLNGDSLALLDSYTVPSQSKENPYCNPSMGCEQVKEINLLAKTPSADFVWFCALHYERYPNGQNLYQQSVTGCAVPKPNDLSENLLQWENPHFTSLDPNHPPVVLNGQDAFTYIAGVSPDYLRILRAHMPNWDGKINWDGTLFSPRKNTYIEEPATILLGFETETAIYFVLRERPSRHDAAHCRAETGGIPISEAEDVTRLIRVCKGDQGGLPRISEHLFGTLAKADLVCQSKVATEGFRVRTTRRFTFTHAAAAHWDTQAQRLYAVFTSETPAPVGSAVCVYDVTSLENAFKGPVIPTFSSSGRSRPEPRENPFPNICEKFSSGNLTEEEVSMGRTEAIYLRRHIPVLPIFGHAVAMVSGRSWNSITGYQVATTRASRAVVNFVSTVLWLGMEDQLLQLVFYEGTRLASAQGLTTSPILFGTCELRTIRLGQQTHTELLHVTHASKQSRNALKDSSALSMRKPWIQTHSQTSGEDERAVKAFASHGPEVISSLLLEAGELFVATSASVYRLTTDICDSYKTSMACTASADPHCAWSTHQAACISLHRTLLDKSKRSMLSAVTLIPAVDRTDPSRLQCPQIQNRSKAEGHGGWSEWRPCQLLPSSAGGSGNSADRGDQITCVCRTCRSTTLCKFGEQQVSQCTVKGLWTPWSEWSDCVANVKRRVRRCVNPFQESSAAECRGPTQEAVPCESPSLLRPEAALHPSKADKMIDPRRHQSNSRIDKELILFSCIGGLIGSVLASLVFLFLFFIRIRKKKRNRAVSNRLSWTPFVPRDQAFLESQLRSSLIGSESIYPHPNYIGMHRQLRAEASSELASVTMSSGTRYEFLPTAATKVTNYGDDNMAPYDRLEDSPI